MTYTLMSVPEDKEVWCTGFRFDDTKSRHQLQAGTRIYS